MSTPELEEPSPAKQVSARGAHDPLDPPGPVAPGGPLVYGPAPLRRSRLLLALLIGYGLALFTTGLMRFIGEPESYPLLGSPRAMAGTYNPGRHAFRTWWNWTVVDRGDFEPIFEAAQRQVQGKSLYAPDELEAFSASFVYTPFTAMLLAPFAGRNARLASVADGVSVLNHVLVLLALASLYPVVFGRGRPRAGDVTLFALAALAFFPLAMALQLTQAGVWIFFAQALAFAWTARGRHVPAGLALAVAVSIKPHLVVVPLVLFFVKGFPRRLLAAAWAGIVTFALASLVYAGWANAWSYVTEVLPRLSSGYAYYRNQSFNGLLLRIFTDHDAAVFNLAQPVGWIKTLGNVLGLSLFAATLWFCRRAAVVRVRPTLVLAALFAAAVLASPVCWMHHFILLIPSLCVAIGVALERRWSAGPSLALLASGLSIGFYFDAAALGNGPAALFSGLELYGALGLVFLLWRQISAGEGDALLAR